MHSLRRAYAPFRLQKIKGKFYLSVSAPKEIAHFYREGRVRRSTGISDRKLAELRAQEIVPAIYREFDEKYDQLDPFVEGLRHLLEREGVDVGRWYREGQISLTVTGSRTRGAALGHPTTKEINGQTVHPKESWVAKDHFNLAGIVTGLGYAVPTALLGYVSPETKERIISATEPKGIDPIKAIQFYKDHPEFSDSAIGRQFLEAASKPRQIVKTDQNTDQSTTPLFSDWAKLYITNKQPSDSMDVHRKRVMACEKFVEVCGDKPLQEYDKIHAIDLAKAMDSEGKGNKTIQNYYSYMRQAFEFAATQRGADGKVVLATHPFHSVNLAEYGKKSRSYSPFTTEELHTLFSQKMLPQDRLILSILITTGMRLDEAALLTWEQIREHDGILCFDLTGQDVRVKNDGSRRRVPVPIVIKDRFKDRKTGRLFSYRMHDGKAETAASKALMKIVRKVASDKTKVVHSLRGNFKDLLRDKGVPKEINDYITGHHQGDVAGQYGSGPSLRRRLDMIALIEHPWL
ncbi:tyrosine-type recombinase/integrase [Roseinatronobacter monicus]|uniref:Site-specific recombinase XerD n=1 Tax=Roseinatronobacter monicus TaxID=393481 RepID=A0A543KFC1_9RHOB|nr:tyrosine-type recombinase/integrase [Roseinatronobacter monicus]TQM93774.1 site-specific recombinase XerD [Roseinatronobacter monicus]